MYVMNVLTHAKRLRFFIEKRTLCANDVFYLKALHKVMLMAHCMATTTSTQHRHRLVWLCVRQHTSFWCIGTLGRTGSHMVASINTSAYVYPYRLQLIIKIMGVLGGTL